MIHFNDLTSDDCRDYGTPGWIVDHLLERIAWAWSARNLYHGHTASWSPFDLNSPPADGHALNGIASNEEGSEQVFVRPFPGPGGRWKVSVNGGKFPAWSAATKELLFVGGDDRIQAAACSMEGNEFSVRAPRVWSPTQIRRMNVQQNFDVFPGGKRVVMFPQPTVEQTGGNLHATLLLNLFDEVRRRVK